MKIPRPPNGLPGNAIGHQTVRFGETLRQKVDDYEAFLEQHLRKLSEEDGSECRETLAKMKQELKNPTQDVFIKRPGQNMFLSLRNRTGLTKRGEDEALSKGKARGLFAYDMQVQDFLDIRGPQGRGLVLEKFESPTEYSHRYTYRDGQNPSLSLVREQGISKEGRLIERFYFDNPSDRDAVFEITAGSLARDIFQVRMSNQPGIATDVAYETVTDGRAVALQSRHFRTGKNVEENVISTTYQAFPSLDKNVRLRAQGKNQVKLTVRVPAGRRQWPVSLIAAPSSSLSGRPQAMMRGAERHWDHYVPQARVQSARREMSHLDRMWETSFQDLKKLTIGVRDAEGNMVYPPTAGIPNYVSLFGRDSLITSLQTLAFNPLIARDTLAVLAARQGTHTDAFREMEPGKILHELRQGELTRLGISPHSPYFGTVDATPLFVMLFGDYMKRTRDAAFGDKYWKNLESALQCIDENIVGDPAHPLYGFLAQREDVAEGVSGAQGLKNIGWKDSDHATQHLLNEDGKLTCPKYPLALAEVQAYVYGAWRAAQSLYLAKAAATENPASKEALVDRAARYAQKADLLQARFNEKFWMPEENFVAMALQVDGQPLASVTTNGAQALLTGIVDADKARKMARRMMAPDMLSGWGMRTLSEKSPAYDPLSYHNGTIWPHDNSLVVQGLARYGFKEEAAELAGQLIRAARRFENARLPEVYGGMPRRKHDRSIPVYPDTCSPQAWAAGTAPMLLASLLGLEVDPANHRLVFRQPVLPDGVNALSLRGMALSADEKVDLLARRKPGGGVEIIKTGGDPAVRVTVIDAPAKSRTRIA